MQPLLHQVFNIITRFQLPSSFGGGCNETSQEHTQKNNGFNSHPPSEEDATNVSRIFRTGLLVSTPILLRRRMQHITRPPNESIAPFQLPSSFGGGCNSPLKKEAPRAIFIANFREPPVISQQLGISYCSFS